jgi:hypothetical protein
MSKDVSKALTITDKVIEVTKALYGYINTNDAAKIPEFQKKLSDSTVIQAAVSGSGSAPAPSPAAPSPAAPAPSPAASLSLTPMQALQRSLMRLRTMNVIAAPLVPAAPAAAAAAAPAAPAAAAAAAAPATGAVSTAARAIQLRQLRQEAAELDALWKKVPWPKRLPPLGNGATLDAIQEYTDNVSRTLLCTPRESASFALRNALYIDLIADKLKDVTDSSKRYAKIVEIATTLTIDEIPVPPSKTDFINLLKSQPELSIESDEVQKIIKTIIVGNLPPGDIKIIFSKAVQTAIHALHTAITQYNITRDAIYTVSGFADSNMNTRITNESLDNAADVAKEILTIIPNATAKVTDPPVTPDQTKYPGFKGLIRSSFPIQPGTDKLQQTLQNLLC